MHQLGLCLLLVSVVGCARPPAGTTAADATATTPTVSPAASAPRPSAMARPSAVDRVRPAADDDADDAKHRPGTPARPRATEGMACGGIAGILCADGLHCAMFGPAAPDQGGVCRGAP